MAGSLSCAAVSMLVINLACRPSNGPGDPAGDGLPPLIMVVAAGLWHLAQLMCSHLSEDVSQGRSGRGSTSSSGVTRLRYGMKQQQFGHGQKEKLRHLLGKGEREGKNK